MKDVITDNYKLLHGDCLERMKEIPDGSIDLILTDIPYDGVNRESNGLRKLDKGKADVITFDIHEFLKEVDTREQAIESYRDWVVKQPQLLKDLHELKGKTLGCFCKPKSCHGDVLVELVNGLGE